MTQLFSPARRIYPAIFLPFLIALILLFSRCDKESQESYDFDFRFITEEYAPFNYTEGGSLTGLAPELLKEICRDLGIPFEVEVLPWSEGYAALQESDNVVLFTTSLNAARRDQFKWAGPFAALEWHFYADAQATLSIQSLDDARQVGAIGVIADYTMEQYLVQQGFTNLVYCDDNADAFQKLLQGEIDLLPSERITAEATLNEMGKTPYHVKEAWPIKTEMLYFAFSPQVPDDVVADMQDGIDQLKRNGKLQLLSEEFLHTNNFPGTFQVYTEDYPPLTFINSYGQVSGYGSDIVFEIMKRNGQFHDVKLSSWSNGYELALNNPNFILYTMDRTDIRENLFQWVGPIGTNATFFYTRAGSGTEINSIDDAKALNAVGTVSSWFSDQVLRGMGFTNLVSDNSPAVMTLKLMEGEIDAFVCSGVTFPTILAEQGFEYHEVNEAFTLMSSDFYIAISLGTPVSVVNQWQSALEAMQQDGTYEAIQRKWFP